ncbi:MAG: TIGR02281 family clan AA aspartic protease [Pseudohongiellaceae bacterium]
MASSNPQNSSKRMGQAMIAIGFILGIGMLTMLFDRQLDEMANPNRNPQSTFVQDGSVEVRLESNRQGHYVMTGAVNDIAADFILDTGATDVVIPQGLARAAGLEYGPQSRAMTANGVVPVYATRIDELQLGSITLHDVRASINPAMDDSIVLLGMSALGQVEFTQRGSRLTLRYYPD